MSEITYNIGRIGLVIRGTYSATTAYNVLDVVHYNSSSYACTADCTGIDPTNTQYWSLLAEGIDTVTADDLDAATVKTFIVDTLKDKLQEITTGNLTADDLYVEYAKVMKLAVGSINAGNITTNELAAVMGDFVTLYTNTAGIDYASIKDLVTNTAIITKGQTGKMYISKLAVTDANMVSLTTGNLILKGADDQFYELTVDSNGEIDAVKKEVSGDNIAKRTIDYDNLIKNSITAEELNVTSIFADEALVGAIKAANIDVEEFFGASAVIDALKVRVIENIPVGGRNLLVGTTKDYAPYTIYHYYNQVYGLLKLTDLGLSPGDTVTLSMVFDNSANSIKGVKTRVTTYSSTGGGDKTAFYGANVIGPGERGKSVLTCTLPSTAVYLEAVIDTADSTITTSAETLMKQAKLEIGELPTDWSPSPDEVIIGSTIELTENQTRISTPEFSIDVEGSDGDMHIGPDGVIVNKIVSPSTVATYREFSTLYVRKNATDAQVEQGNYFRSITAAFRALEGKSVEIYVTIDIEQNTYYEGYQTFYNITGGRSINIYFNNSVVVCAFEFYFCHASLVFNNLKLTQYTATSNGMYFRSCKYVGINSCVFTARSDTTGAYNAVLGERGACLDVGNSEFYGGTGTWASIRVYGGAVATSRNNKGNAGLSVSNAIMVVEGTQPSVNATFGYYRGLCGVLHQPGSVTVDQGSATPPEPETATDTFNATTAHTVYGSAEWPGSWKSDTNYTWQGYTNGMKHQASMFWFSGLSALSGKTILSAKLKIKRAAGTGKGADVKVKGYYGDRAYNNGSGSPNNRVSMGTLGNIANGETVEFTIPTAAISYLASNPSNGCIALNPGDDSTLSGKVYSSNYCKFYGIGGSRPKLEITYVP